MMEPLTFVLAAIITLISGVFGGMVGGSYLILIPALLFLGLDIHHVIGITKILTITLGLVFINYMRKNKVDIKSNWPYFLFVFVGSIVGSFIVIEIEKGLLQKIIAVLMMIIALFLLFDKKFGVYSLKVKVKKGYIGLAIILFFILGIYLGFYAAAASIFSIMIFTALLKKDFVGSIGNSRINDLVGGVGSAVIFASQGLIDYTLAIPLAFFYFIGGWVGSNITLKKGSVWVRYPLIIIAFAFAIKLLFFG